MAQPLQLKRTPTKADRARILELYTKLNAARLLAESERKRVDEYAAPLLAKYAFRKDAVRRAEPGAEQELITNVEDLYLTSHEERVTAFYEELSDLHAVNGFTGPRGHCPALIAGHELVKLENEAITLMFAVIGEKVGILHGKNRERALKLLDGLGASIAVEDSLSSF